LIGYDDIQTTQQRRLNWVTSG